MPPVKQPPKKLNGNAVDPHYQLTLALLTAFQNTWKEEYAKNQADPVTFSRLSLVALTQLAALVAVDVGMSAEQFGKVCEVQHAEAFKNAPRFGE